MRTLNIVVKGRRRLPKKLTRKILRTLLAALVLFTAFAAYGIWTYAAESDLVKTDAAIVLGTKVIGDEPSPALRERINHAVWLYDNGFVDKIIFTGGKTDGAAMAESEVSRKYALELDVPDKDILVELKSLITEENFEFAGELAEKHGLHSFLIVSDPLHMKRALLMAHTAGMDDVHSSPTTSSVYQTLGAKTPFFIREVVCYVGYVLSSAIMP